MKTCRHSVITAKHWAKISTGTDRVLQLLSRRAGQTNWIGQARLSPVLTPAFVQLNLHPLSLPSGNATLAFLKLQLLVLYGNSNSASKGVELLSVGGLAICALSCHGAYVDLLHNQLSSDNTEQKHLD